MAGRPLERTSSLRKDGALKYATVNDFFSKATEVFETFQIPINELLDLAFEKFSTTSDGVVRQSIISILNSWASSCPPPALNRIKVWANANTIFKEHGLLGQQLQATVSEVGRAYPQVFLNFQHLYESLALPKFFYEQPVEIVAQCLADCITDLEAMLLKAIHPSEFIFERWQRKPAEAPMLSLHKSWVNHMIYWYATVLLLEGDSENRTTLLKIFLAMGERFVETKNFNGLFELVGALELSSLRRMETMWAKLTEAEVQQKARFRQITDANGQWANYRQYLDKCAPPALPWVPAIFTDLVGLNVAQKDLDLQGLINVKKALIVGKQINTFIRYRKAFPDMEVKNPHLAAMKNFILHLKPLDDDNLFQPKTDVPPPASPADKGTLRRKRPLKASTQLKATTDAVDIEFSLRDWAILTCPAEEVELKENESIFRRGSKDSDLYRVNRGYIAVKYPSDKEKEGKEIKLSRGELFNFESLLFPNFSRTISSAELCSGVGAVQRIPGNWSRFLCNADAAFSERFYRLICLALVKRAEEGDSDELDDATLDKQIRELILNYNQPMAILELSRENKLTLLQQFQKQTVRRRPARAKASVKVENEADGEFNKRFGFIRPQIVIRQYEAEAKKSGIPAALTVYLSISYLTLSETTFSKARIIPWSALLGIELRQSYDVQLTVVDLDKNKSKDGKQQRVIKFRIESDAVNDFARMVMHIRTFTQGTRFEDSKLEKQPVQLSDDDWTKITRGLKLRRFADGEAILSEGANSQSLFKIDSGLVKVLERGKAKATLGTGDAFGEGGFLNGTRAPHAYVASGPVTCYAFEIYYLTLLFQNSLGLAGRFYYWLGQSLLNRVVEPEALKTALSPTVPRKEPSKPRPAKKSGDSPEIPRPKISIDPPPDGSSKEEGKEGKESVKSSPRSPRATSPRESRSGEKRERRGSRVALSASSTLPPHPSPLTYSLPTDLETAQASAKKSTRKSSKTEKLAPEVFQFGQNLADLKAALVELTYDNHDCPATLVQYTKEKKSGKPKLEISLSEIESFVKPSLKLNSGYQLQFVHKGQTYHMVHPNEDLISKWLVVVRGSQLSTSDELKVQKFRTLPSRRGSVDEHNLKKSRSDGKQEKRASAAALFEEANGEEKKSHKKSSKGSKEKKHSSESKGNGEDQKHKKPSTEEKEEKKSVEAKETEPSEGKEKKSSVDEEKEKKLSVEEPKQKKGSSRREKPKDSLPPEKLEDSFLATPPRTPSPEPESPLSFLPTPTSEIPTPIRTISPNGQTPPSSPLFSPSPGNSPNSRRLSILRVNPFGRVISGSESAPSSPVAARAASESSDPSIASSSSTSTDSLLSLSLEEQPLVPTVLAAIHSPRASGAFDDLAKLALNPDRFRQVAATAPFEGEEGQLSFAAGDLISIVDESDSTWWIGEVHGSRGKFPAAKLRPISPVPPPASPPSSPSSTRKDTVKVKCTHCDQTFSFSISSGKAKFRTICPSCQTQQTVRL